MNFKKYDDEYLSVLTNKGILKRSYKDLEGISIEITNSADDITATFDDITVTLKENLSDSTCTCPSRSICKHIITAVLYLNQGEAEEKSEETAPVALNTEEILSLDETSLFKAIGASLAKKLAADIEHSRLPEILEGNFISIQLSDGHIIKLLTPIKDSVCSCKSNEMCKHKALAILYYKAYKGRLDLSSEAKEKVSTIDYDEISQFCLRIEEEISHILSVGLSRISHSLIEHLEKLSLSSHNLGLARHENIFRELSIMLSKYFLRDMNFSEVLFLKKLSDCYFLAENIINDKENISEYMGVFKEEYADTKALSFIPLGDRYLETASGYAGNIYYFLEEDGEIYSYSDLRPTFYDKSKSNFQSANLLWNLNSSISTIMDYKFTLKNPKVSSDRRISSSNQISGSFDKHLQGDLPISQENITYDFRTLITMKEQCENDKVSILMTSKVLDFGTDKLKNVFFMTILDENDYPIDIELKITKANEKVIRILKAFADTPTPNTLFIGIVYAENSRLKMVPIEYYSGFAQETEGA